MKNLGIALLILVTPIICNAQDWNEISVPASAGEGKIWQLQEDISDDFNYDFQPTSSVATIGNKWTNFFHNGWSGPLPTVWKRDHVFVENGKLKVKTSRTAGVKVDVNSGGKIHSLPATNLGCITSTRRVQYPVFVETYVKITRSVLASDVWMLSPDDTQEIDICEAYGSDRWTNEWFSSKRLHLSHHVFIRSPFQDWQPNDAGSFYTNGTTHWRDNYHRIGVYWKDPWNLEYYVDGKLVRTRSGKSQIDPNNFTNGTGLNKEMDIIINTEDQSWRAVQGLSPTEAELENTDDHTFKVDWIRVYKPVAGEVGPVTGVTLDKTEVNSFIGAKVTLDASVIPNNAADVSVIWESDKPDVATVSSMGLVECKSVGVAIITVTTNENQKTARCTVSVSQKAIDPSVNFDDNSKYLNAEFPVGGQLKVKCTFHAGTGNTVIEGGSGGIKFWLRELKPGWAVANDYIISDGSAIGKESGMAEGIISLKNVPPTAEIPTDNWYYLFVSFKTSDGKDINKGIWPINIVKTTDLSTALVKSNLKVFPNPTNGILHIQGNNLPWNETLQIISSAGEIISTRMIQNGSLDVSNLSRGIYFITVRGKNPIQFIKE